MTGADIIKTLIELLEAQEQIKITYELEEREGGETGGKAIPTPERGA